MPSNYLRSFAKAIFAIINIMVSAVFFLGCYAKWFSPARWWFISLFTLASFYLFVVLIIFFIGWLLAKSRWAFLFILVVIATFKPLSNIIPFRLPSSFNIKKQPKAIRVMSWNVESFEILKYTNHAPEEKSKMIQLINQYDPDIACFQEMTAADSATKAFYHLKEFTDSLHFPYHYYAYDIGDDYYPATHTHYGKIIFSKFPIINRQSIKHYPNDYNSTFEYADVVTGDDTLRVFNIHLQTMKLSDDLVHDIDSPAVHMRHDVKESKGIVSKIKSSFPKRQLQAEAVKAEVNQSPYPVIICGDFNDVPNSYAYSTIGEGLQNAFVEKGAGIGRTFSEILPSLRIDNIFVDNRFEVLQYTRIKKRLSDHYPIITDIKVP